MIEIERQIELVKNDILQRFPKCSYTIRILLWDDGTSSVECRHGNNEGTKVYTSTYYKDELTFEEIDIDGRVMIIDEFGNEQFKYLTDEKPPILETQI
jgi:hypothetical protein